MSPAPSLLFRLAGLAATVFVLTVFVMIAALFSDPALPINRWLNRYAIPLLLGEVALLAVFGISAMMTDRGSQTVTGLAESSHPSLEGEGASASDDSTTDEPVR